MSKLVDGKIPAKTECPFKSDCLFAGKNLCHHTGINHIVSFSCGSARAFDLIETLKNQKEIKK